MSADIAQFDQRLTAVEAALAQVQRRLGLQVAGTIQGGECANGGEETDGNIPVVDFLETASPDSA